MPCDPLLWSLSISGRHGCHLWSMAAPSPAVYQGSALSNQPGLSKYEGYGCNSRRVRGWWKLLNHKGSVPPPHLTASSSPGYAEQPVCGSASSLGFPLYTAVCWHAWAPSPSEGTLIPLGPPLPFLWCRMFDVMTCSIEAMCCHNVTSLNKVFRAVFTEPEHEQQNPPITVSFCVVVKVSNVSNFLW